MTFEVEVTNLNSQLADLLLDRIIETIKDFGVAESDFRIFLDAADCPVCDSDEQEKVGCI